MQEPSSINPAIRGVIPNAKLPTNIKPSTKPSATNPEIRSYTPNAKQPTNIKSTIIASQIAPSTTPPITLIP
jgi:hypothetical protein